MNSIPINPNYIKNNLEKKEDHRKNTENLIHKQKIRVIRKLNYLVTIKSYLFYDINNL